MGVDHYENFPVASLLCPRALRPAVVAIYRFARTADDIADEGSAPPEQRLRELNEYRAELNAAIEQRPTSPRWSEVFTALANAIREHQLPPALLHALLDAFEQDVRNPDYADRAGLLDYCSRSANPVGRLLLHLYAVHDAESLQRSDAICSALQLINFWQDLGIDQPRGRNYLPLDELQHHGVQREPGRGVVDAPALRELLRELCNWTRQLMLLGAPLALRLPGRVGWELRLVVQGGLRVLDHIGALGYGTLTVRPTLSRRDMPRLVWRAAWMRAASPT